MQKDYSWNPSTYICKYGKYLKSILCDEIMHATDIVYIWQILYQQVWQMPNRQMSQVLYQQILKVKK